MTVRMAELAMAVAMALLSVVIMIKSTDGLSIWWVPEKGPGSGVWPFWLSFLMLLSCLAIIFRWYRGVTPQSRSTEPFMDRHAVQVLGVTVAALFFLILGAGIIGIYFSLFAFLFFYIKIVGRHSWVLSITLTGLLPVGVFILFEYALTIPLPKGYTEQLFFPIYKLMYGRGAGIWAYILSGGIGCLALAAPHYVRGMAVESGGTFVERDIVQGLGSGAAVVLLLFATSYFGIYLSLFVFLLVALKVLGRQSWLVTGVAMVAVPLLVYAVVELALGVPLPKGMTAGLFG